MSKRWFTMVPTAALALAVLAACGGTAPEEGDVTRVPDAANAPATEAPAEDAATDEGTAEATDAATEEATEEATSDAAASPAADDATPAAAAADDATPAAAAASDEATPMAAAATPMAAAGAATPMAAGAATPMAAADEATPMAAADEATPAAAGEATPAGEGATPEAAAAGDAEMQEFTVVSRDIFFDPKELIIPADTEVLIHLPNEGAAPHNFVIEELGVRAEQAPGEEHEITLTAPAGTYDYICDIPGHKEAGMVGVLTAE